MERQRGRIDAARTLYNTVLSSEMKTQPTIVQIWWDFAEMEWMLSRNDAALGVISRAGGQNGAATTGVGLLRLKRRLEEQASLSSGASGCRPWLKWVKLGILLELLSGTINTAIKLADSHLNTLEAPSTQHSALTVNSLLVLYHHTVTLKNSAPPALLRSRVQQALALYPSNTIILGLFLECEKGEGIWGRVRDLLGECRVGVPEKTFTRRVAELWIAGWEKSRWEGEIERLVGERCGRLRPRMCIPHIVHG